MSMILFEDRVAVPDWIARDIDSFRRWARSGSMPEHGHFAFLGGDIWADASTEEIFRHNRPLARILAVLESLVTPADGYLFWQRVFYTNYAAGLSTEPDCLYVSAESIRSAAAELVREESGQSLEVHGTVDMTLEVVSKTSVRKDTVTLRTLYHRAGVREYWIVDVRTSPGRLEILRRAPRSCVPAPTSNGWQRSDVFGREFRLDEETDPHGHPLYTLATR